MTYKLFLDDERNPQDVTWVALPEGPWVVVRTVQAFMDHIRTHGMPEFIAFDHDLGVYGPFADMDNGYWCAKWLVCYCMDHNLQVPPFEVHSMNPVGAENIREFLNNAKAYLPDNPFV